MALRKRTGTAAKYGSGEPLVVVPPADELRNAHVAAPAPAPSGPIARRSDGKLDGSEAARELGRRGGLANAEKRARAEAFATRVRMASGLPGFDAHAYYATYAEEAEAAFAALVTQLGEQSDGVVSAAVSSIARSAIQQTYAGRWIVDLGTGSAMAFVDGGGKAVPNAALLLQGSRLLEAGRQSLIAAHHLQTLEAEARARGGDGPDDAPWVTSGTGGGP